MVRVGLVVANTGLGRFGVPRHLLASHRSTDAVGGGEASGEAELGPAAVVPAPAPSDAPVLWRFGWEAAQRRLRDDAVAHQCRCMLRDRAAAAAAPATERPARHRSKWAYSVMLALLGALESQGRPPPPVDERRGAADPSTWGSPLDVRSERISVEAVLVKVRGGGGRLTRGEEEIAPRCDSVRAGGAALTPSLLPQLGARVGGVGGGGGAAAAPHGAAARASSTASSTGSGGGGRAYDALCADRSLATAEDVIDVLDALAALPLAPVQASCCCCVRPPRTQAH